MSESAHKSRHKTIRFLSGTSLKFKMSFTTYQTYKISNIINSKVEQSFFFISIKKFIKLAISELSKQLYKKKF